MNDEDHGRPSAVRIHGPLYYPVSVCSLQKLVFSRSTPECPPRPRGDRRERPCRVSAERESGGTVLRFLYRQYPQPEHAPGLLGVVPPERTQVEDGLDSRKERIVGILAECSMSPFRIRRPRVRLLACR